ncbi:hypothetical protein FC88_GL000282 [Companilactobacillus futsaii JCM 17355]|nr:hypothetical protein FC88_GL000282 [Companilactobacillus futsaii JCM 17355]
MDNLFELSTIFDISIDNLLKENDDLKDEFEKQQIIKNANFFNNFGKGEELLFSLTLIFIGFKLAPLGLAIPIIYWFIKVKTVKKAKKYEK